MTVAMTKVYRQNRANFPADELKRYDGQWVAFSPDGRRVVASGESIAELSEHVVAARNDLQDVVLERIELEVGETNAVGV
jgi:hypothetical protein